MSESPDLTLRQMEMFRAIAALHSFSAAAARLGISQPALSTAVRRMEASLKLELFHRTTRRIELTEAGRLLLARVTRCLSAAAALHEDMEGFRIRSSGVVRVAAPPLLAAAVLPRAIRDFAPGGTDVAVEISDVDTDEIVEMVRSGHVAFGIGTFPHDLADLSSTVLMRDEAMLFCHPAHPAAAAAGRGAGAIRWADIADLPQITLRDSSSLRAWIERGFAEAGLTMRAAQEVNQISTVLGLVRADVGVAVLPACARALVPSGQLTGVRLTDPAITRDIALLHAPGRRLAPPAKALADAIRRTIHDSAG